MKATFLSVRVVFILFIGFFLSSCGRDFPELLGMEKGIWYKMPPNKKDEYMATYSEIIHIRNTFSPNKISSLAFIANALIKDVNPAVPSIIACLLVKFFGFLTKKSPLTFAI